MTFVYGGRAVLQQTLRNLDATLRNSFICRRCLHHQHHQQQQRQSALRTFPSKRQTPFLVAFKKPGHHKIRWRSDAAAASLGSTFARPLDLSIGGQAQQARSSFPPVSSRAVGYWLLASATSVFGIVVFGGLTRLTESGLSITEWRPVTGSLPPMNEQTWEEEFARYKLSPEFVMLNSRMSLEDFKKIYFMEWFHRLWGRVVGITFLVPTIYFVARRRVSKRMAIKLVGICGLIGFQGFIGWWMVKSGLKDDLFAKGSHPRVSQYRLAAHLGTAFVAYMAMLWNGLRILQVNRQLASPAKSLDTVATLSTALARKFRRRVAGLGALIFCTAMSGALVAGLDAGLIYNDFPWMGQSLIPPRRELFDTFYVHTPSGRDLVWRNMLENPVLVQLDHRLLATTTFTAVLALWLYARGRHMRKALPLPIRRSVMGLVHLVSLQVTLGITTLWYLVPTPLAAAHQAGALALLSGVVVLGTRLHTPVRVTQLLRQATLQRGLPISQA